MESEKTWRDGIMKKSGWHSPKNLLVGLLVALALLAAACSSSEDSSVSEPEPGSSDLATVPVTEEPQTVSVPAGIPELPPVDPSVAFPQPTAEDALFDFLFPTLNQFGYTLVSSCEGFSLEANPNLICSVESTTDLGDQFLAEFTVGQPPPGISWYSVFVMEVPGEGWQVTAATEILRVS